LIDRKGNIKLCDFSISGQLVNSIAKTRDVGCRPYMAPERIEPSQTSYDVTSDVWSLGISLIELATGKFPYPKWKSVFDQLTQVGFYLNIIQLTICFLKQFHVNFNPSI